MDCPKCSKGKIRVNTTVVCMCGHHPLCCDQCYQMFDASHNAAGAMMTDDTHRQAHEEMAKRFPEIVNGQSYEEMMRETITKSPDLFPLLEDFKASLAKT